jgi:hypothetical protein
MKRRTRLVASAGAVGASLLLLLPLASRATAQEPALAGLSMLGTARALQINFGFQDYVLGNFVDIGIPHAYTELSSLGGGESRAVASQVFPGDLVSGNKAARENIPGFREANYPANGDTKKIDADDDTYTIPPLTQTAGPLTLDTSHLKTHAGESGANALVTTQKFALAGSDGPLLQMTSMETTSDSNGVGNTVVQEARTTIRDLTLRVSADLSITIGQINSFARSSSNGTDGEASANFVISDVDVNLSGQHLGATIDADGIQLVNPVSQLPLPTQIPQSLSQEVSAILDKFGVSITTSKPVKIVNGPSADASVGGLLITLRGAIPSVYTPDAAKPLVAEIYNLIPEPLQKTCPPPVSPLCITPAIVPGPGQGFMTSFAIGLAHAAASAATPFELGGVTVPPGGGFGGPSGFGGGGFSTTPTNPVITPSTGGPATQNGPLRLYGLVAKMPAAALLVPALVFLVFAIALAMGPSLRRWREMEP